MLRRRRWQSNWYQTKAKHIKRNLLLYKKLTKSWMISFNI
jgi:hypothetical protein